MESHILIINAFLYYYYSEYDDEKYVEDPFSSRKSLQWYEDINYVFKKIFKIFTERLNLSDAALKLHLLLFFFGHPIYC